MITLHVARALLVAVAAPLRLHRVAITGAIEWLLNAVAAAGSYNVGGPYLLGSAPQWFSDDTHHDHVHAGFTT